MTRVMATIAVVMLGAAPLPAAQDASQPRTEQARQRLAEIKDRLQLTPQQVEQVRPVFAEEMQRLTTVRDKYDAGGLSRRGRRQLARELRDIQHETDDRLNKILSKPQMEEMKKIRDEQRQQLRAHRKQV